MQIKSIKLQNFRNFKKAEFKFDSGLNVIVAPNGSGKTNIVEAISYLSVPKSFRRVLDKNLIHKDVFIEEISAEDLDVDVLKVLNDFARGVGNVVDEDGDDFELEFFIQQNNITSKVLKVKGKKEKTSKFVGNFYSVIFSPEVIDLINSSPSKRRSFIDRLISTFNPDYLENLTRYKEVLRSRNKLLSDSRYFNEDVLNVFDKPYVEYGVKIIKDRLEFFSEIAKTIDTVDDEILKEDLKLSIQYLSSIGNIDESLSLDELEGVFREHLKNSLQSDYRRGSSQKGPHRDDFQMKLNGFDLDKYGSRGQQRMGILSLLFSYIIFLENSNRTPVILLDDVFSELDKEHRHLLLDFITSNHFQVIITATEVDEVLKRFEGKINYINL